MSEGTARRQRLVEEDRAGPEEGEPMKVDADWLLTRLAAEAEADIADLYDEAGDLLPIRQWPAIWRQGLVTDLEISALYEGTGRERREIGHVKKVKFAERLRRLELIGKHIRINAFKEIVEHKGLTALAERLERAQRRSRAGGEHGADGEDGADGGAGPA
ncbi:terminase small subunit [Rhizobium sp. KDH_Rht_773_N]